MKILKPEEYEEKLAEIANVCEKCKVENKVFDEKCKKCNTYEKAMSFRKAEKCPDCGEVVYSSNEAARIEAVIRT